MKGFTRLFMLSHNSDFYFPTLFFAVAGVRTNMHKKPKNADLFFFFFAFNPKTQFMKYPNFTRGWYGQ